MLAREYKETLQRSILDVLWRKWSQLGVLGYSESKSNGAVTDPEALLIFSAAFCRYDQRLYDLIADWLMRYGSLINLVRLKSLLRKTEYSDSASLGYWAELCVRQGQTRWKSIAKLLCPPPVESPMAMFTTPLAEESVYIGLPDETALRFGFLRTPYSKSNKVLNTIPQTDATLLLTLRGHYGVCSRAEVMLMIALSGGCSMQKIVQLSGYTWPTVTELIEELRISGVVTVVNIGNKAPCYVLSEAAKWKRFYNIDTACFPLWSNIFDALGMLWKTVFNPRLEGLSEFTFRGELARIWQTKLQALLLQAEYLPLRDADIGSPDGVAKLVACL